MGFKKGLWRIQFKSYLPIIEEIEFTFFFRLRPLSGFLTEGILQLYTSYIKLGYCNAKWIFLVTILVKVRSVVYIKVKFAWRVE